MRLLVATGHPEIVGGVETYLREFLPLLLERGHEIALLTQRPLPAGQSHIADRCPPLVSWNVAEHSAQTRFAELDDWRPDACYLQGMEDPDLESMLIDRVPTLLYCHNHYGLCISGTKRFGFPSPQPCPRILGPKCLALYFPRRCGGLNPITMIRLYREQRRRQQVILRTPGIAIASRYMLENYRRLGVAEDRLHLLPYFPTAQKADPEAPSTRSCGLQILLIGRLTELKGSTHLVRALPIASRLLNRPLKLVVAGDGPERPALEKLAHQLNVDVQFTGWIGPAEREQLYRTSDLLVVPSTWSEPFGLVGIEAGCVGLPAVGFAVGGIPDWLIAGVSGEIAPGDLPTLTGLADAIHRALRDPLHWQQLRVGAWNTARRFTSDGHLDQFERVIRSITNN